MSWEEIQRALIAVAVAAITGIVGRWFGVKVEESQRTKLQWALEQGVAYAQEYFRNKRVPGAEKQQLAHQVAHSLAPKALEKVGDEKARVLLQATYARLKTSLPDTSFVMKGDDIPVDIVDVESQPTPLPRPKVKLPS